MSKIIVNNISTTTNNNVNVDNFQNMPPDPAWFELIEFKDISGLSSVAFDHTMESGYNYRVKYNNISHSNTNSHIGFQLRTAAGVWKSGATDYTTRAEVMTVIAAARTSGEMNVYFYSGYTGATMRDDSSWRLNGWMDFFNLDSTTVPSQGLHIAQINNVITYGAYGAWGVSNAHSLDIHNGIRLANSAGLNFTQGTMVLTRYKNLTA